MESNQHEMLNTIRSKYGLYNLQVMTAMGKVPRDKFILQKYKKMAYSDQPLDIGFGQTISQPYTVAFMTHLATEIPISLRARDFQKPVPKLQISKQKSVNSNTKYFISDTRVLEIGTGSGYQAAVLSYFFDEVYTIEIIPGLAKKAIKTLEKLGYKNVYVKIGSGEWGWEEKSPYDVIIATAGMEVVPQILFDQLKMGGILIAPVGIGKEKMMIRFTKLKKRGKVEMKKEEFGKFKFVPFVEAYN